MTHPETDPHVWAATQRWLDEFDRDPTEADMDDRPHDLDEINLTLAAPAQPTVAVNAPAPRFNKAVAAGFAAATVLATVAVTVILLSMRTTAHTAAENTTPTTQISVAAAPPDPAPADTGTDSPIPFTASAACPPGSTAAQAVAGDDPGRAWVCVRNGVDGQVFTLDLGRTMVITAVSITPGWVGTDSSGADQWPAHRLITRVQWIFNDNATTVVTQLTGNVHGEAVQPIPHRGVLASKITAIILETSRPPTDSTTTTSAAPDGLLDSILGAPPSGSPPSPSVAATTDVQPEDPADNTFAVSSVKVLGHPPQ